MGNDSSFFYKENQEYFIVSEYNQKKEDDNDINNFFKCKRTWDIVQYLDSFKTNNPTLVWIDKDTSLIILLKLERLADFEDLKNQIMKIEEDEYFFRKYIIIYDDKWEKELQILDNNNKSDKESLVTKLNKELLMVDLDAFRKNSFENSKWHLIIQLFVKLPFLSLKIEWEKLVKLSNLLDGRIKNEGLEILNNFIISQEVITLENKKENNKTQEYIQELKDIFLWGDDKKVEKFLNTFTKSRVWK